MRLAALLLTLTAAAAIAQTGTKAKASPAAKPAANKLMSPDALNEKAPAEFRAKFITTKGEFVIKVTRAWAPLGADRFYNLVKNGFYDGSAFHRVHPGFVAQFGLHPNASVQSKWQMKPLKDEKVVKSNLLGYVSYAAFGADSRTTQVFVNLKDNKSLDVQGFPPFGDVVKGIGVLAGVYGGYGDKPQEPRILLQGAAYLKRSFPQLDYVTKAVIE